MASLWKVNASNGEQVYVVATNVVDAINGVMGVRGINEVSNIFGIEYVDTVEVTDQSADLSKSINAIGRVDLFSKPADYPVPIIPTPIAASDVPFGGDILDDAPTALILAAK